MQVVFSPLFSPLSLLPSSYSNHQQGIKQHHSLEMGGKGAPLSPSPSSAICCMCGDHGLPQELFRCKSCHFRSQHKYCSDLYPRADAYRACNWCLRESGGRPLSAAAGNNGKPISPSSSSDNTNVGGTGAVKLNRGSFSSHLNKPVKKQQVHRRSLSDVNDRMGSRQAFRGKVRRYKLLEEVSS